MTSQRQVRLRLESRTVTAAPGDRGEELHYAGIAIQRLVDGDVVEQTWVPLGTAPTYADDEALIAEWHAAVLWSGSRAHTQPP